MSSKLDLRLKEVETIIKKRGLESVNLNNGDLAGEMIALSGVIVTLDQRIKLLEQEKLLQVVGVEKLFDEITEKDNKIYYRNYQLKRIRNLSSRIIVFAKKVVGLLSDKKRKKRGSEYLGKMSGVLKDIINLTKQEKDEEKKG